MSPQTRPNVLLITADHWPGALLGCAGQPCIQTPTLDRLAAMGTRFTRAYSEHPICGCARRTLYTGLTARSHSDRQFDTRLRMPAAKTVAQLFRDAGYQAYAVGKLHVYPPRDRIGFDDALTAEEGRANLGWTDDYDLFLGDRGRPGQQYHHGLGPNEYISRPWHLSEELHHTNWIATQMARTIQRRDPTRPGFWHLSFVAPHPPLTPPACYLDLYRNIDPPAPVFGDWSEDPERLPYALKIRQNLWSRGSEAFVREARRAFYAMCTHVDHQMRIVLGTLREEGLLDRTAILFTSDHGDMLGDHGQWVKHMFHEGSAAIPMIVVAPREDRRVGAGATDARLAGLQDVCPTLLDLAGIGAPATVDGTSLLGARRREWLYGEFGEIAQDPRATRMVHDGRFKLIYYPIGNRSLLFDLEEDRLEQRNLAENPDHKERRENLEGILIGELYGGDEAWVKGGRLVGLPDREYVPEPNRNFIAQRGSHWPPPRVL